MKCIHFSTGLQKIEELYYLYSKNKGADQLRGYSEADLRLCFRLAECFFSHDAAEVFLQLSSGTKLKKQIS